MTGDSQSTINNANHWGTGHFEIQKIIQWLSVALKGCYCTCPELLCKVKATFSQEEITFVQDQERELT